MNMIKIILILFLYLANSYAGFISSVDNSKVKKIGDTMTGTLTAPAIHTSSIATITPEINIGLANYDNGNYGIGLGWVNYTNKDFGIGIGINCYNNNSNGIGIGYEAQGNNSCGIGIGEDAKNNSARGIGIGFNTSDNYNYGVGIGYESNNNYNYGIGMGYSAKNNYSYAIGIGYYSQYNSNYATSVGGYTRSASSSCAYGWNARTEQVESISLGAGSLTTAPKSVSIGAYTVNDDTETIKMGYKTNVSTISKISSIEWADGTIQVSSPTVGISGISGSGTANYIPIFTAGTVIDNSAIYTSGEEYWCANDNFQIYKDGNRYIKFSLNDESRIDILDRTATLTYQGSLICSKTSPYRFEIDTTQSTPVDLEFIVSSAVYHGGDVYPITNNIYNLGKSGLKWNTIFGETIKVTTLIAYGDIFISSRPYWCQEWILNLSSITTINTAFTFEIVAGTSSITSEWFEKWDDGSGNLWCKVIQPHLYLVNTNICFSILGTNASGIIQLWKNGNPWSVTNTDYMPTQDKVENFSVSKIEKLVAGDIITLRVTTDDGSALNCCNGVLTITPID